MITRSTICFTCLVLFSYSILAQVTLVKGSVVDAVSEEPLPDVLITLEGTSIKSNTDEVGIFVLNCESAVGNQVLILEKTGYLKKRFPIVVNKGSVLELGGLTLDYDVTVQKDLFVISLSEDQLNSEEDGLVENMSGLLQSSKDVFLNAAAYDFSATFFRPRGLDNASGKVLINGIEMNKLFNGRPQWGNWGGLNDAQRNQEFTMGMSANDYSFGDLAGTNNIVMRASRYIKGGRLSIASANRSYQGRLMASYNSGLVGDGWAFSLLASRRFGEEGYVDGTLYDANSLFISVEKKLSQTQFLNLSAIYAKNRRGRSNAISDEVFQLKGNRYNSFWGYQNGEIRNSRIREVNEPIVMLNHFWDITSKAKLNTNISYQFGKTGNTRIDNGGTNLVNFNGQESYIGGGSNPDPAYYQNLPSYFFRNSANNPDSYNYEQAYLAEQELINNGQLDWPALYSANIYESSIGNNAIYALQEDINEDKQLTANTILDLEISDKTRINSALNFKNLRSENYAMVNDLLGGSGFLDVDFFAEEIGQSTEDQLENIAQSDLENRNRIVVEGDRYKYNYKMDATIVDAFSQIQVKSKMIDFYLGGTLANTSYQRIGLFENGNYPGNNSNGKSEKTNFFNYGIKSGLTYKISGRHLLDFNASYFTKAPTIRNSFENARQNNYLIQGLESETIYSADISYIYRSPYLKGRISSFYSQFKDGTDLGYYFTEDLAGRGFNSGDAFVQEILTGVDKRNLGVEFGLEYQVTTTIKLKAAASVGQYIYSNRPNIYLTSDDFDDRITFGDGKTNLKNLHLGGGPERAYQIGFEYRDPDYWWFGATTNYFSNAYINVSKLARSSNFTTDFDGQPYNNFDLELANSLLKQEKFNGYLLVNAVGGKSWLIKKYFLGFFASVNNILGREYKTGGFEQSRLATYPRLLEEKNRSNGRIFGPRYFFGYGTTYYLNLYVRF
ncbi:CarboxypepD_reg-like domain-containing protein [Flavobacteriaceae bacterium MAR_2010_188]|nr:CarboxypepD_reg-like domain-containing protein [Flavobacteriaceae bacterium MAR_2010_188]